MFPTFETSIKQVQAFAARAAHDDDFRELLESRPADAMKEYGFEIDEADIPDRRTIPSKAQCAALLAILLQYDAYAEGEYDPKSIWYFILFYGFAMPLVPTAEGEVGAAR
jgi:hypothetical protein